MYNLKHFFLISLHKSRNASELLESSRSPKSCPLVIVLNSTMEPMTDILLRLNSKKTENFRMHNSNPESLTLSLSNPKSGAMAVVVYSTTYAPSMQVLASTKRLIADFPSIQLISINADEHRNLLNLPILNVTEVPSVLLFFQGRSFAQPLTESYQIYTMLKKLGAISMEMDEFEQVGTSFKLPAGLSTDKWRPSSHNTTAPGEGAIVGLLGPVWTIMESLYDI